MREQNRVLYPIKLRCEPLSLLYGIAPGSTQPYNAAGYPCRSPTILSSGMLLQEYSQLALWAMTERDRDQCLKKLKLTETSCPYHVLLTRVVIVVFHRARNVHVLALIVHQVGVLPPGPMRVQPVATTLDFLYRVNSGNSIFVVFKAFSFHSCGNSSLSSCAKLVLPLFVFQIGVVPRKSVFPVATTLLYRFQAGNSVFAMFQALEIPCLQ